MDSSTRSWTSKTRYMFSIRASYTTSYTILYLEENIERRIQKIPNQF